jgi:hypothetical protein
MPQATASSLAEYCAQPDPGSSMQAYAAMRANSFLSACRSAGVRAKA